MGTLLEVEDNERQLTVTGSCFVLASSFVYVKIGVGADVEIGDNEIVFTCVIKKETRRIKIM